MRYYFQIVDENDKMAVSGYFKASSEEEACDVVHDAMNMTHGVQAHVYSAEGSDEPKHISTMAKIKLSNGG